MNGNMRRKKASASVIRERADLLVRYMGYDRKRGRKKKALIPELMQHFDVSRSTIERALRERKSAPAAAVRREDSLARAHAAAAKSPAKAITSNVDENLRIALTSWLSSSPRRTPQSVYVAKVLLETLTT